MHEVNQPVQEGFSSASDQQIEDSNESDDSDHVNDAIDEILNANGIETVVSVEQIEANKRIYYGKCFENYVQFEKELKVIEK
jgi:hypothetical protein